MTDSIQFNEYKIAKIFRKIILSFMGNLKLKLSFIKSVIHILIEIKNTELNVFPQLHVVVAAMKAVYALSDIYDIQKS